MNNFESIENEKSLFYRTHENVTIEQHSVFYDKQVLLEISFGILYLVSALIIAFLIKYYYKKDYVGLILIICLGLYVWYPYLCTGDINIHLTGGYSSIEYYFYILHLFPYLFLIYKETYVGETFDITAEVKIKEETKHQDILTDLNDLFKMGLITEEEYVIKKEQKIKEKISNEIRQTQEYKLLLKSKEKGLLNEVEFKSKLEILINENYTKQDLK